MLRRMKKYILLGWLILLSVSLIAAQTEEPLPLDASIASFSRAFTISYPSSFLEARAAPLKPDTIILSNRPYFLAADHFLVSAGELVILVEYGTPTSLFLPADGDAYSLAKDYHDLTTKTKSDLLPIEIGDFSGYEFTSHYEVDSLYIWRVFLDLAPQQIVWFSLATPSLEEQNRLAPTFKAIIMSLRLGASAGEYSEVFEGYNGFTIPYPEGWFVETDETGSIMVMKNSESNASKPLADDQPVALITFGTIRDVTGNAKPQSDPRDDAALIIEMLFGIQNKQIRRLMIGDYPAAMIPADMNAGNTIVAILLDEQHFIAASIFKTVDKNQDFPAAIVDMLLQATWEGVEAAPTP